jgi:hypothetical protein
MAPYLAFHLKNVALLMRSLRGSGQFIAKPAVEAFDKRILLRPAKVEGTKPGATEIKNFDVLSQSYSLNGISEYYYWVSFPWVLLACRFGTATGDKLACP